MESNQIPRTANHLPIKAVQIPNIPNSNTLHVWHAMHNLHRAPARRSTHDTQHEKRKLEVYRRNMMNTSSQRRIFLCLLTQEQVKSLWKTVTPSLFCLSVEKEVRPMSDVFASHNTDTLITFLPTYLSFSPLEQTLQLCLISIYSFLPSS